MKAGLLGKNESFFILRIGLAVVFISNALMPFLASDDYADLIHSSFLANILPVNVQTFGLFTAVNDLIVACLLVSGKGGKYVAAYASAWIIGVICVFGTHRYLDILEHIGFLSIAMYLLIANLRPSLLSRLESEVSKTHLSKNNS